MYEKKAAKAAAPVPAPRRVESDRFLTEEVVADHLGVSPRTLRNWRSLRKGPPFILVMRSPRYSEAALFAWLDAQPTGGAA